VERTLLSAAFDFDFGLGADFDFDLKNQGQKAVSTASAKLRGMLARCMSERRISVFARRGREHSAE
jgi:hypothetical protein